MSLPGSLSGGSTEPKIQIPRQSREHLSDNDRTGKGRTVRVCLNCRLHKVKCTGELQCQRCVSVNQPCVYPQGHNDRLKTITEQKAHMITLMRHLSSRVEAEDKRQIEDLLESLEEDPLSTVSASEPKMTDIETLGSSNTNSRRSSTLTTATSEQPYQNPDAGTETAQEPSQLGQLRNLHYGEKHLGVTESAANVVTVIPSRNRFQLEYPAYQTSAKSSKRGADHFQIDTALLEMFWYLQTQSEDEAKTFLEHIRSSGPLSLASTHRWLQERKNLFIGDNLVGELPVMKRLKLKDGGVKGKSRATDITTRPTISEDSEAECWGTFVTIATVKSAVDMFFKATGLLFHILSKEQGDVIQQNLLNGFGYSPETPFTAILARCRGIHERAQLIELCGMASVGLGYLRIFDKQQPPPKGLSDYFYATAKLMLDNAIEVNPLRAMKGCALLAMYNIVVKSGVAMAYVELGLGLAQMHGIYDPGPWSTQRAIYLDHKRTWRTLLNFSGWLAASIGYVSERTSPNLSHLEDIEDAEDEDIIQRELVKVTIIKSRIMHAIPKSGDMGDNVIDDFRKELKAITKTLPEWMTLGALLTSQKSTPLRRIIMYFHLFFLSAMELLYRRAKANSICVSVPRTLNTTLAVREGLMAAKLAARILALMRHEDSIVQLCWLCIYTSYTSGLIVLQAAVQKMLNHSEDSPWIADLTLVNVCIDTLRFCAEIDPVAVHLANTVSVYMYHLQRIKGPFQLNANLGDDMAEDQSVDYLFAVPHGDSIIDKAARDLQCLIRYPFGTQQLELVPEGGPKAPPVQRTLVSWMEAAVGVPQEWSWELQNCAAQASSTAMENEREACRMGDVMTNITPGYFVPTGDAIPWSTWTTQNFM